MCLASLALAVLCFASSLIILPAVKSRLVDPAVRVVQAGPPPRAKAPPRVVAAERPGAVAAQAAVPPARLERTSP